MRRAVVGCQLPPCSVSAAAWSQQSKPCTATGRQQASNNPKPAQIHSSFEAAAQRRGVIRSEASNVAASERPQDVLMRQ